MIIHLLNGKAIEHLATSYLLDRGVPGARVVWAYSSGKDGGMYGILWNDGNLRFLRVPVAEIPTYEECEYSMAVALQRIRRINGY